MDRIGEILKTEFDEKFIQGMRDRMVMSFYKYGSIADAYPAKVDAIRSLMERLHKYAETGNTEFLMDVANFAMIEFLYPKHNEAHFKPTDDDQSPGRVSARTGQLDKRDNQTIGTNSKSTLTEFR